MVRPFLGLNIDSSVLPEPGNGAGWSCSHADAVQDHRRVPAPFLELAAELLDNDLAGSSELLQWHRACSDTEGRDGKSIPGSRECQEGESRSVMSKTHGLGQQWELWMSGRESN